MVLRPGAFGQTGSSDGVSTPPGPGPGPIWDPKLKNRSFWEKKSPCGNTHRQTKLLNFKKWTLWEKKSPCGNTHRQTKLIYNTIQYSTVWYNTLHYDTIQ